MAQQPFLKMEISDSCVFTQHLVGGREVKTSLKELGPPEGLVVVGVYHYGECYNWRETEAISDAVGVSFRILYVEMELLQVCEPLLMAVILQISLCLHEL